MEHILLGQFFYDPMGKFGVRELSRLTHLDTKTVMKYLRHFVKMKVIIKKIEKGKFPYYEANRLSKVYRIVKSNALVNRIAESGLIDFLEKELKPKAIVLFGSVQKGTYIKNSDIDFFIQGPEKKINLEKFEHELKHEVQLFFEVDLNNLSDGLRGNIIDGNTLSGALEL